MSQEEDITTSAARDLLTRVFQGSVCRLVAHLFEHETISPKDWERLPQLIDEEPEP